MRKKVFGRHLSRDTDTRKALMRSLLRGFFENGKIVTTYAKAKTFTPEIDKIFKGVRKGTLSGRRMVLAQLGNDKATTDLIFSKYAYVPTKRTSGFTRIISIPARRGDNARMARIELVDMVEEKASK